VFTRYRYPENWPAVWEQLSPASIGRRSKDCRRTKGSRYCAAVSNRTRLCVSRLRRHALCFLQWCCSVSRVDGKLLLLNDVLFKLLRKIAEYVDFRSRSRSRLAMP